MDIHNITKRCGSVILFTTLISPIYLAHAGTSNDLGAYVQLAEDESGDSGDSVDLGNGDDD